jgi:glycosyltransferase involved in cell wall biosynthesis
VYNGNYNQLPSLSALKAPKVLMVSPEYPPINGGVGRYTYNLVQELKRQGIKVYIVCDKPGRGDFVGLSPQNPCNSEILCDLVDKIQPDIVHIQYEPGLYGLKLHSFNPNKIYTTVDLFYEKAQVPIITTFHSGYTLRQWMRIPEMKKEVESSESRKSTNNSSYSPTPKLKCSLRTVSIYWKYLANYYAFQNQNKEKLIKSAAGIVFSNFMKTIIDVKSYGKINTKKTWLIYHGSEPKTFGEGISKQSARSRFPSLLQKNIDRIALAFGFTSVAKGWDILRQMRIPDKWVIIVNSSVNHSTGERIRLERFASKKSKNNVHRIINLNQDYLSEEDLSALIYASDTVLLPYKVTSGSGVMFDALGHGIPFIASDLPFFNEFASKGLGITARRTPKAFTNALLELDNNYDIYKKAVDGFKKYLKWDSITRNHIKLYNDVITNSNRMLATIDGDVTHPRSHPPQLEYADKVIKRVRPG